MELLKILEYPKNFLLYFMMDFDVLITMELFSLNKLISLGRKEKFFMGVGTLKIFYCLKFFCCGNKIELVEKTRAQKFLFGKQILLEKKKYCKLEKDFLFFLKNYFIEIKKDYDRKHFSSTKPQRIYLTP